LPGNGMRTKTFFMICGGFFCLLAVFPIQAQEQQGVPKDKEEFVAVSGQCRRQGENPESLAREAHKCAVEASGDRVVHRQETTFLSGDCEQYGWCVYRVVSYADDPGTERFDSYFHEANIRVD